MKNDNKGFFDKHKLGLLIGLYGAAALACLCTGNISTFALLSVVAAAGCASMTVLYKAADSINRQINDMETEELHEVLNDEYENNKNILEKEIETPVYKIDNVSVEMPELDAPFVPEPIVEVYPETSKEKSVKVKSLTNNHKKH